MHEILATSLKEAEDMVEIAWSKHMKWTEVEAFTTKKSLSETYGKPQDEYTGTAKPDNLKTFRR